MILDTKQLTFHIFFFCKMVTNTQGMLWNIGD